VAMPAANAVAVVNLATLQVVKTISVPPAPQEVVIRPGGQFAHVSCDQSHQVAAIQINNWSVKLIDAGAGQMVWHGLSDCVISSVSRGLSVRSRKSKSHPTDVGKCWSTSENLHPRRAADRRRAWPLGDFLKSCKSGRAMNVEALDGIRAVAWK
jgi:hypothetical protein